MGNFQTAAPSVLPTQSPTLVPTVWPTAIPSLVPTAIPSLVPTVIPSVTPTCLPSKIPTYAPTYYPTTEPTKLPTVTPTIIPTTAPTFFATEHYFVKLQYFSDSTCQSSIAESLIFTSTECTSLIWCDESNFCNSYSIYVECIDQMTFKATDCDNSVDFNWSGTAGACYRVNDHTGKASFVKAQCISNPTGQPTSQPSTIPTMMNSNPPIIPPSNSPTVSFTSSSSAQPSNMPTTTPSQHPSSQPSTQPTKTPSSVPTSFPSKKPSVSICSTSCPSNVPTSISTNIPTGFPSSSPTIHPTTYPSSIPSSQPSISPTSQPTIQPSYQPTGQPTNKPSTHPSLFPSLSPIVCPTGYPTSQPSNNPSSKPSSVPSCQPTKSPSNKPTSQPTTQPTTRPTSQPSIQPSTQPSPQPSTQPTARPTSQPSIQPSTQPTARPTSQPSRTPTNHPTTAAGNSLISDALGSNFQNSSLSQEQLTSSINSALSKLTSLLVNANSSSSQTFVFSTELVSVLMSRINLLAANSSRNSSNSNILVDLTVPGSDTKISLALSPSGSNGGGAVVSIVEYDPRLWSKNVTTASTSPAVKVVSGVISIGVNYGSGSSKSNVSLPTFSANFQVSAENRSTTAQLFLSHNCTRGVKESVSMWCPDSKVRMNVTCLGNAAAIIHQPCPVVEATCSVVSTQDLSVLSNDYCTVESSTSSSVACACGYNNNQSSNNAANLLGSGGSLSIAVTNQFVTKTDASNFVAIGSALSSSIASESTAIFLVFGCFWGVGIGILFWHNFAGPRVRKSVPVVISSSGKSLPSTMVKPFQVGEKVATLELQLLTAWIHYLHVALPSVYKEHSSWLHRFGVQMFERHRYIRILGMLLHPYYHQQPQSFEKEEQAKRKMILFVTEVLTGITLSFCLIAILYDFQFPSNDGTCESFVVKDKCLARKTVLDPTTSYCNWTPPYPDYSPIAAIFTQTFQGNVMETLSVESSSTDKPPCEFNENNSSIIASVVSVLIACTLSAPLNIMLHVLFSVINGRVSCNTNTRDQSRIKRRNRHSHLEENDLSQEMRVFSDNRSQLSVMEDGKAKEDEIVPVAKSTMIRVPESTTSPYRQGLMNNWYKVWPTNHSVTKFEDNGRKSSNTILSRMHENFMFQSSFVPEPSEDIQSAREECEMLWKQIAASGNNATFTSDLNPIGHKSPMQSTRPSRRTFLLNSTHSFYSNTKDTDITTVSKALKDVDMQAVKYASDTEYAILLLQRLFLDTLYQEKHSQNTTFETQHTFSAKIFAWTMHCELLYKPVISTFIYYFAIFLAVAINFGALYFILLKGFGRGSSWQINFLSVCILEWLAEIMLMEPMEIFLLDFLIPDMIYKQVTHARTELCALISVFLFEKLCKIVPQTSQTTTFEINNNQQMNILSHALAEKRPLLLEAQLALFYHPTRLRMHRQRISDHLQKQQCNSDHDANMQKKFLPPAAVSSTKPFVVSRASMVLRRMSSANVVFPLKSSVLPADATHIANNSSSVSRNVHQPHLALVNSHSSGLTASTSGPAHAALLLHHYKRSLNPIDSPRSDVLNVSNLHHSETHVSHLGLTTDPSNVHSSSSSLGSHSNLSRYQHLTWWQYHLMLLISLPIEILRLAVNILTALCLGALLYVGFLMNLENIDNTVVTVLLLLFLAGLILLITVLFHPVEETADNNSHKRNHSSDKKTFDMTYDNVSSYSEMARKLYEECIILCDRSHIRSDTTSFDCVLPVHKADVLSNRNRIVEEEEEEEEEKESGDSGSITDVAEKSDNDSHEDKVSGKPKIHDKHSDEKSSSEASLLSWKDSDSFQFSSSSSSPTGKSNVVQSTDADDTTI